MAMQDYVWWAHTSSDVWASREQAYSVVRPIRSDGTTGEPVGFYAPRTDMTNGYSHHERGFPFARGTDAAGVPYRLGAPSLVINGDFIIHLAADAKRTSGDNPDDGAVVTMRAWKASPVPATGASWTPEGAPGGGGLSVMVDEQYVMPLPLEGGGGSEITSLIGFGANGLKVALSTVNEWHAIHVGWMRTYGELVVTSAGK